MYCSTEDASLRNFYIITLVRAVTQACNLHIVGQFLKPKDAMLFPLEGGNRMANLKLKS